MNYRYYSKFFYLITERLSISKGFSLYQKIKISLYLSLLILKICIVLNQIYFYFLDFLLRIWSKLRLINIKNKVNEIYAKDNKDFIHIDVSSKNKRIKLSFIINDDTNIFLFDLKMLMLYYSLILFLKMFFCDTR